MVSTRPPTSKSSCPFSNPLVTVPNAPITIGIIIIIFIPLEFFTSVLADSFTQEFFLVTASLLKSPGLVSGFWLFLAMLSFGKSLLVRQLQVLKAF